METQGSRPCVYIEYKSPYYVGKAWQDLMGFRFEPASGSDLRRGHHNLGKKRSVVRPPRPVLLNGIPHVLKEQTPLRAFTVRYSEKRK